MFLTSKHVVQYDILIEYWWSGILQKLTAMHDMPDPPTLLFIDSSFVSKSKKWSKFPVTKSNVHSSNTARFLLLAQSYPNESL